MKRLSSLLLSIMLLCVMGLGCGGSTTALTPAQVVSHTGYATVGLVFYDADNEDSEVSDVKVFCSAVWVDSKHILTAEHCVKAAQKMLQDREDAKAESSQAAAADCDDLAKALGFCSDAYEAKKVELLGLTVHYVQWAENDGVGREPTGWHVSHVVAYDSTHDLALLEAVGNAIPEHQVATLGSQPALLSKVHVVGHTKGYYWTFLEGTVSGYHTDLPHMDGQKGPYMQVEAPVYFGNSGGGAFNEAGELVGIADFLTSMPGQAFFVPVSVLRDFLNQAR